MKNENTGAGSMMIQETDGHREYIVAYPPIPRGVFKEETQSYVDDQNEWNSNQQVFNQNIYTSSVKQKLISCLITIQLKIPMESALTGDAATTGLDF